MSRGPYSDTTSPSVEPLPAEWKQLERLATRLGLGPQSMHQWGKLQLAAIHNIMDRLDKIEADGKEINRG